MVVLWISFAIPIDVAMNVADQLKKAGKVQRGRLGVVIQEMNYNLAKSFGLSNASGALITQVIPNGAADKAGLQMGDIVLSVNGEAVTNSSDLPVMVGLLPPGKQVILGIWRKGKKQEAKVVLDNMVSNSLTASTNNNPVLPTEIERSANRNIGINLRETPKGLIVEDIGGWAAQSDIQRGDVILAVGQILVYDQAQFDKAVAENGKHVPLLIKRGNNTLFVALNLP